MHIQLQDVLLLALEDLKCTMNFHTEMLVIISLQLLISLQPFTYNIFNSPSLHVCTVPYPAGLS